MLQRTLIGILIAGTILGYIYSLRTEAKIAKAEISALAIQVESSTETIKALQDSINKQKSLLITYNNSITDNRAKYNESLLQFNTHGLEFLSFSKPGLIEVRINEATKEVFNEIENETAN